MIAFYTKETNMENENDHPLHRQWHFYLHHPLYTSTTEKYGSAAYESLCCFQSVEDFWYYFVHLPRPSQIFGNALRIRHRIDGKWVEALGLFQGGTVPEWEHNPKGGHLEFGFSDPTQMDDMWELLCLLLIGETMWHSHNVIGVRCVDKTKGRKPNYRFEVWVSSQEASTREGIIQQLLTTLNHDFTTTYKIHPSGFTNDS